MLLVILAPQANLTSTVAWLRQVQQLGSFVDPAIAVVAKSLAGEVSVDVTHQGAVAPPRLGGIGRDTLALVVPSGVEMGEGVVARISSHARTEGLWQFQLDTLTRVGADLESGLGAIFASLAELGWGELSPELREAGGPPVPPTCSVSPH